MSTVNDTIDGVRPIQPYVVYAVEVRSPSEVENLDAGQHFILSHDPLTIDTVFKDLLAPPPAEVTNRTPGGVVVRMVKRRAYDPLLTVWFPAVFEVADRPKRGDVVWSAQFGILLRYWEHGGTLRWVPYKSPPQRVLDQMRAMAALDPDGVYDYFGGLAGGIMYRAYEDAVGLSESRSPAVCPESLLGRLGADLSVYAKPSDGVDVVRRKLAKAVLTHRERFTSESGSLALSVLGGRGMSLCAYRGLTWACVHLRFRRWKNTTNALRQTQAYHKVKVTSSHPDIKVALRPPLIAGGLYYITDRTILAMSDAASWHAVIYFVEDRVSYEMVGATIVIQRAIDPTYAPLHVSNGTTLNSPTSKTITLVQGTPANNSQAQVFYEGAFQATVSGGAITSVTVADGGSYPAGSLNVSVTGVGSGASLTPVLTNGVITSFTIVSGGTGYSTAPTIRVTASDMGASACAQSIRDALASWAAASDQYLDVATAANVLMPWGLTLEGHAAEQAGVVPTAAPQTTARSASRIPYAPVVHWPVDATVLVANGGDGAALDWSAVSDTAKGQITYDIAAYTGEDPPVLLATAVVGDLRASDGTPSVRPVASDPLTVAGGFEILSTAVNGSARSPAIPGHSPLYAPVFNALNGDYLDNMAGLDELVDRSSNLRPAGQTAYLVTTA